MAPAVEAWSLNHWASREELEQAALDIFISQPLDVPTKSLSHSQRFHVTGAGTLVKFVLVPPALGAWYTGGAQETLAVCTSPAIILLMVYF